MANETKIYAADVLIDNMTDKEKELYTIIKDRTNCVDLLKEINNGIFEDNKLIDICEKLQSIAKNNLQTKVKK